MSTAGRSAVLTTWAPAGIAVAAVIALAVTYGASSGRIKTLEGQVAELQEVQADDDVVRAESERMSARIQELEAANQATAKRNDALSKQYAELQKTTKALEKRIEAADLCSAGGISVGLNAQGGLPRAVWHTRRAILQAATECDFVGLASLATAPDFVYSFSGGGHPGEYWREAEGYGEAKLWYLARVLDLPYRQQEIQGEVYYIWPSASGYGDWDRVPAEAKAALGAIYDQDIVDSFADFGGYFGHRVGITENGEWKYFVAGD